MLLCLLAACLGSGGGWAYTASTTIATAGVAGQGAAAISPFAISGIAYTLNVNSPKNVDSVGFTLAPTSATTTKVQLAAAGSWYGCTNTGGAIACTTTTPQATAVGSTNLTIVATQ